MPAASLSTCSRCRMSLKRRATTLAAHDTSSWFSLWPPMEPCAQSNSICMQVLARRSLLNTLPFRLVMCATPASNTCRSGRQRRWWSRDTRGRRSTHTCTARRSAASHRETASCMFSCTSTS
jgi:hypothetical protein